MSDRHFLYLDKVWVKQQLDQLEQPVRNETLRRSTTLEGGLSATAKIPLSDVDVGGSRRRQNSVEVQQEAEDTPERAFARYYDHVKGGGRLRTDATAGLVTGQRYELQGQLDLERGVLLTDDGAEIAVRIATEHWRHDDDAAGIPIALFGVCLRPTSLRAMAIYVPDRARAALARTGHPRRRVLVGLAAGLALAGGGAVLARALTGGSAPPPVRFRIAGGPSEFFADPDVRTVFRSEGVDIEQTEFGSAQILTVDRSRYDAVFPATINAARQVQSLWGPSLPQAPSFGSPMAVMSWVPVVEMLAELGIARQRQGLWVFDMEVYLRSVEEKVRWPRLYGSRQISLRSTDPASSGSAQMLVAILGRVANGSNPVTDPADVPALAQRIRPCFANQGIMDRTTRDLLKTYSDGPSVAPMIFAYENDAVTEFKPGRGMVFLYPTPNVRSEHHFIVINAHPDGERVGDMLRSHPRLTEIAMQRFGFRYGVDRSDEFATLLAPRQITVPTGDQLGELVLGELPSKEILEGFINALQTPKAGPA